MVKKNYCYIAIIFLIILCIFGWGLYFRASRSMASNNETIRQLTLSTGQLGNSLSEIGRINTERDEAINRINGYVADLERIKQQRDAVIKQLRSELAKYKTNQQRLAEIIKTVNIQNGFNPDGSSNQ